MAANDLLCYGDFIMDFHVLIFIKKRAEKGARRTLLMLRRYVLCTLENDLFRCSKLSKMLF